MLIFTRKIIEKGVLLMKTTKLELFIKAIPAGILLGLADMAYLKVGKATIEGAFIFSIALLAIMKMRYCLFTGRVARLISKKKSNQWSNC